MKLQKEEEEYRDRVAINLRNAEDREAWERKGGETIQARIIRKIAEAELEKLYELDSHNNVTIA